MCQWNGERHSSTNTDGPLFQAGFTCKFRAHEAWLAPRCTFKHLLWKNSIVAPPRGTFLRTYFSEIDKSREKTAPGKFWTHSLLIAWDMLYRLATATTTVIMLSGFFQLCFLACPGNKFSRMVNFFFRIHLSQLYLPIVAFVCPVTNTLFLPGSNFFTGVLVNSISLIIRL